MTNVKQRLLRSNDPSPTEIINSGGASQLLLTGDHSGNLVPAALGDLGVAADGLARHIGWDIGIEELGRSLAARLDAMFVRQRYSRLVIDCNRDPGSPSAIPEVSDGTPVPGNVGLDAAARERRVAEIHAPYQNAIGAALDTRPDAILVALHSFTPTMDGMPRPWHIGVLHAGHEDALARRLLAWLEQHAGVPIGDNEPYRMDSTDYSVPRHAFAAGRSYVEIEVRQDLLADAKGFEVIAELLARGLNAVHHP